MITAFVVFLASAATQPGVDVQKPVSPQDRDPVICERHKEVGSLLNTRKICKRKSEWAEDRRNDRANIERSQSQQGINGN